MNDMRKNLGYVVELYMPDADPNGVRIIEKMNWSGQGIAIPRSAFTREKSRAELNRPGVYVLVGNDEQNNSPLLYIGEGDPIIERLSMHATGKQFWTGLIAFTSKDGTLNKAHIQYLEARLIQLADSAKKCALDNTQRPSEPTMSEAIKAVAEGFFRDLLLCMPLLGADYFELTPEIDEASGYLELSGKGVKARGYETTQGFVVTKGSEVTKDEAPKIPAHLKAKREELKSRGILKDAGPHYSLLSSYTFDSPSMAAGVVLGNSSNGRWLWRNKDGVSLGDIEARSVKELFNLMQENGEIEIVSPREVKELLK